MITIKSVIEDTKIIQIDKTRMYWALLKPRLSFLVAFSAGFGFLLGAEGEINWLSFLILAFGGFLISGASIIINQVLEKDIDKLMKRTQKRPLPTKQLTVDEAIGFGFLIGLLGFTLLLIFTNFLTALLSLFSMFLYGFIYTPLKRIGPIAVIVGAIPGALPPLLGWVAARGEIGFEGFILFLIQFAWQFPHFWAIAWVMDEDYQKAGFKLLPSRGGQDLNSAIQIMLSTLFLIPLGLIPYQLGISGLVSAIIVTMAGFFFLIPVVRLVFAPSRIVALQIMFGSFIYLPIIQIAYLLDKI
ncbi:MAG: heme o synthase [Microscillaceae bacterium]|nr:heme o synthase [Microscillaceae bacterium]